MSTITDPDARKLFAGETEAHQARAAFERASSAPLSQWEAHQDGGSSIALPRELSSMITKIVETIARGGTVTVGSMPQDVTTTVAADLLGISRPTLMKLVAEGALPAHKVGSHTRLRSADVVEFKKARLARRRQAAEELLALEDDD